MARNISGSVAAASAAESGTSFHLIRMSFRDLSVQNELFINTSSQDIVTSAVTGLPNAEWVAIGAGGSNLTIGRVRESSDFVGQAMELSLDGVDQTIIAILGNNFFRGQPIDVWRVWVNRETGTISASVLIFSGLQNEEYEVSDVRPQDSSVGSTCTVSTRVISSIAYMQKTNEVLTNPSSHNDYLRRVGVAATDASFRYTKELVGREIAWATRGLRLRSGSPEGRPARRKAND